MRKICIHRTIVAVFAYLLLYLRSLLRLVGVFLVAWIGMCRDFATFGVNFAKCVVDFATWTNFFAKFSFILPLPLIILPFDKSQQNSPGNSRTPTPRNPKQSHNTTN